jgi:20S proteasome alpha/beta subunit
VSNDLGALAARFRYAQQQVEGVQGAQQLALERLTGAVTGLAAAADGSGSEDIASALGNLAEAEIKIAEIVELCIQARDKIDDHLGRLKLAGG